ncbi:MAG TPA: FtsX-like permease family protein, partial [Blastocatellia bacterium]|nr:FtsX-like permease family protein [Blastocatellia bacterium]
GSTAGHNRVRSLLVISEVALSFVLLAGAGLMLKSFIRILQVDPGFDPSDVVTMNISLSTSKYPESRRQREFFRQVIERVRAIPQAAAAGAVSDLPLSGAEELGGFFVEGRPAPTSFADLPLADFRFIDHDYFNAMRIPLVRGRYFTERDNENAPGVVIISESLARRFFPGEDPIGKRVKEGDAESKEPWLSIVGVVRDVRHSTLAAEPRPQLYFPYLQRGDEAMTIVVRAGGDLSGLIAAMRNSVWSVDKDQPVTDIKTLNDYLAESVAQRRFQMALLGGFAIVAILLAAVGIYGVMSYSVTQRTHEIGIRMSMGASRRDVLTLIVGQGMKVALGGVFVGLAAALALMRVLASLLYEVSATDPATFAAIAFLLVAVAFLASYIPAHRAARVDPCVALRHE